MKKVTSRGKAQAKSNKPISGAMGGGTYSYPSPKGEPKSRGAEMCKSNKYTGGGASNYEV